MPFLASEGVCLMNPNSPRQSGRFEARRSSPRLAAEYNLEHDPLQSDVPLKESGGMGMLREFAKGAFASHHFSAGLLVVILLLLMVWMFTSTAKSLFSELGNIDSRDPSQISAEPSVVPRITQEAPASSKNQTQRPAASPTPGDPP